MGREVRRVALDFDWPLNKVWDGFMNPHYQECDECGAGYSPAYAAIARHLRGAAALASHPTEGGAP